MASSRKADGKFKKGTHWRDPKPYWQREWLVAEYVTKGRSAAEIAKEQGCGCNNILYWIRKHGIETRTTSQSRTVKHWGASGPKNPMYGRVGDGNPNWKGGVAPERQKVYSRHEWKVIKRAVFERDRHCCRRCGCAPSGHKNKQTHHIRGWARYPLLRLQMDNIITVCAPCHRWIHSSENVKREFLSD